MKRIKKKKEGKDEKRTSSGLYCHKTQEDLEFLSLAKITSIKPYDAYVLTHVYKDKSNLSNSTS
jgi:hypothetical protein